MFSHGCPSLLCVTHSLRPFFSRLRCLVFAKHEYFKGYIGICVVLSRIGTWLVSDRYCISGVLHYFPGAGTAPARLRSLALATGRLSGLHVFPGSPRNVRFIVAMASPLGLVCAVSCTYAAMHSVVGDISACAPGLQAPGIWGASHACSLSPVRASFRRVAAGDMTRLLCFVALLCLVFQTFYFLSLRSSWDLLSS